MTLGARRTTLWGPTAIRGDLDPDKKTHIIAFFELVNELPQDLDILQQAFDECAALYAEKTLTEYPPIVLPHYSTAQQRLAAALGHAGEGKI
ncbi:unnamed protein product, partial [marine sediment metagenome]